MSTSFLSSKTHTSLSPYEVGKLSSQACHTVIEEKPQKEQHDTKGQETTANMTPHFTIILVTCLFCFLFFFQLTQKGNEEVRKSMQKNL